jgi:hypothetical protein
MTSQRLHLTGPDGRAYVLGDRIEVHDGRTLIGRVQSVSVSPQGDEVRLENFLTVDFDDFRARALAKLVLAEVVMFLCEGFPSLHTIGVELSRDIEGYEGRETKLANARADILQSIGATSIQISPKPHAGQAGHFAVTGLWHYDTASIDALAAALQNERTAYCARREAAKPPPRPYLGKLFRKDSEPDHHGS